MDLYQRLRIAIDVLCGRDDAALKCTREHVEPGQVRINDAEHQALLA